MSAGDNGQDQFNLRSTLIGALSLTAALSWNEAAKALIGSAVPPNTSSLFATLIYAGLVTVLIVVLIYTVNFVAFAELPKIADVAQAFQTKPPKQGSEAFDVMR